MITRTLTQVKVFDVKANGELIGGQGGFGTIPELNWVEGKVWESDEECERLLNEAIADWQERRNKNRWGTTPHKPELIIYWKTITVEEKP